MRSTFVAAVLLMVSAVPVFGQRVPQALAPDAIYFNGKVVTVDKPFTIAQAFAVKGDRFIAVGTTADMRALAGPKTQLVDLKGHTVIPGIIDNHHHMIWKARTYRGIDMVNVPSLAEMLQRIQQEAAQSSPGKVIIASGGWTPGSFPEKRGPTKKDLDSVAPKNPVLVFQNGRNNVNLNSAALKVLGIDQNTLDWGSFPVLRDDTDGSPSGEMSGGEQVYTADTRLLPQPTLEQSIQLLERVQLGEHALGLTTVRELVLPPEHMKTYWDMHQQGRLTMRVALGLMFGVQHVDGFNPTQMDQMVKNLPPLPGMGDDYVWFDGTLAEFEVTTQRVSTLNRVPFPDGQPVVGLSIARWPHSPLLQPVRDSQGRFYGIKRLPTEAFIDVCKKMNRMGYRPAWHISGDGALDWHLQCYEAANADLPIKGKRWVAEHNGGPDEATQKRLANMEMLIALQRQWGPLRQQVDNGLMVSLGSDFPAFGSNPFFIMAQHVTRTDQQTGRDMGQAQRITREEALRMYTYNSAYLTFMENKLGSIESGKLADFLVLSADLMTVPDDQIKSILPLATFVGGRKVFSKEGGGF